VSRLLVEFFVSKGSIVNRVSHMKICILEDGRMTERSSAVK
jgi:hypothetical protein